MSEFISSLKKLKRDFLPPFFKLEVEIFKCIITNVVYIYDDYTWVNIKQKCDSNPLPTHTLMN